VFYLPSFIFRVPKQYFYQILYNVAIYSIMDLEQLSGIKAATLRVWEKRYAIPNPKRTQTNIRYYDENDLRIILNIVALSKHGHKISKIAIMSESEMTATLSQATPATTNSPIDVLQSAMMAIDETNFCQILQNSTEKIGFEATMIQLVYPFLERLGVLWMTGVIKPVHANFVSCIIRQKLLVALDQQMCVPAAKNTKKYLLYLPEGENQELGLLFVSYLLRRRSYQVIYVGHNISVSDLSDICSVHQPNCIYTIIGEVFTKQSIQHYVNQVCHTFPNVQILFSGYQVLAHPIQLPSNGVIVRNLEETLNVIEK
jgi:MerR family transcriptional regulator, light-induced transcriptional regulator